MKAGNARNAIDQFVDDREPSFHQFLTRVKDKLVLVGLLAYSNLTLIGKMKRDIPLVSWVCHKCPVKSILVLLSSKCRADKMGLCEQSIFEILC